MISITPFSVVNTDYRGITARFSLCRAQANFLFLTRKSGTISGNTYHKGKSSSTTPKIFILLSGKLFFSYRKIGTTQSFKETVIAPSIIEVQPFIAHNVEAIEDIILIECNSIHDIENDRIKEIV